MTTIDDNASEVTSKEDQFFGVKTQIKAKVGEELPAPEITVESDEGKPAEKAAAKPAAKKQTAKEKDDAELASYGEGVQKRLAKMRWKQGEVERERDAIKAERDEAFRVAQTLHGQNQNYVQTITTGEARLVAEIKQRSSNAVAIAKTAYAEAYEKGDTAKIIEAQEAMLNANADLRAATQYETDYKQRTAQPQQPQQPQGQPYQPPQQRPVQRQVPSVPKPTEDAANWAEENPWFGDPEHADMTALAYGVHENLIKHQGVKPDTPEYFEAINAQMRQRFPEHFTEDEGEGAPVLPPKKTPATVVGSAQKQTPKNTRKVTLKASQVRLAKRLGLSVEQYAAQLIKEGNVA